MDKELTLLKLSSRTGREGERLAVCPARKQGGVINLHPLEFL